jgi:thiol-disulfide isomerase/thioredoxin
MTRKLLPSLLVLLLSVVFLHARQAKEPFDAYTKVGDPIPAFTVTTVDGAKFDSRDKGKVLVVNLWATWCGPCKEEMPRLEAEIWQKHKSNLALVAIAREETDAIIAPFRKSNKYTFPMAQDPDRKVFKLFASAGIPRTYVVSKEGKIVFQSLGYTADEFGKLKVVLEAELKK